METTIDIYSQYMMCELALYQSLYAHLKLAEILHVYCNDFRCHNGKI